MNSVEDVINKVMNELPLLVKQAVAGANVPVRTGNLRDSIKLEIISPTSYRVYIDEEQAPYAADIEQLKPYWNRVAVMLSYRLASLLGSMGKME